MKKKGFTLIELLVVIAIIALLMGILMPALNRVRQKAYQLICGTNVKGLMSGITVYSQENNEQYPFLGNPITPSRVSNDVKGLWGMLQPQWRGSNIPSITACLFMLIKYADVSPKQYVCKASGTATPFDFSKVWQLDKNIQATDITQCWDFGKGDPANDEGPWLHNSYSYQMPFWGWAASATSEPRLAILADANPWIQSDDKTGGGSLIRQAETPPKSPALLVWDPMPKAFKPKSITAANSKNHNQTGQNVAFNDGHVSFERMPNCGVDKDNIYTTFNFTIMPGTGQELQRVEIGQAPPPLTTSSTYTNVDDPSKDSFLIH